MFLCELIFWIFQHCRYTLLFRRRLGLQSRLPPLQKCPQKFVFFLSQLGTKLCFIRTNDIQTQDEFVSYGGERDVRCDGHQGHGAEPGVPVRLGGLDRQLVNNRIPTN